MCDTQVSIRTNAASRSTPASMPAPLAPNASPSHNRRSHARPLADRPRLGQRGANAGGPSMNAVELIALAASTSLLAGWRLYLVTLVTGLSMKFGWIALPDQLAALDVLANNWLLAAAALGTLAEFFADKIAWVDSAWDAVHSFIRP